MTPPDLQPPSDEGHEDRIQRAEGTVQELVAGLAVNTSRLETLDTSVREGFANVNLKIDSSIAPLATRLNDHIAKDMVVADRVSELERAQAARVARSATLSKWLWPLVTMASGALMDKLLRYFHIIGS